MKDAFSKYVSGEVVEDILSDPSKCSLGGAEKELTIFFSDLSGFTTISEKFKDNPAELVALLNHYLNAMSVLIQAEGGTVDRYEGDAIFAFFNAPLDMPDHRMRACRARLRPRSTARPSSTASADCPVSSSAVPRDPYAGSLPAGIPRRVTLRAK